VLTFVTKLGFLKHYVSDPPCDDWRGYMKLSQVDVWGSGGIALLFLTSALDGREWLASRIGRFTRREIAGGSQSIGGWVGPRADLDVVKYRQNSCPCRESNPGRPASSLLIYRLNYPDSEQAMYVTQDKRRACPSLGI
jgi:hypothetical protein